MRNGIFDELEHSLEQLRHEIADVMEGGLTDRTAIRSPACDLVDHGHEYVMTAELPGARKEDIKLEIEPHGVRVRAATSRETKKEAGGFVRRERVSSSFERYLRLNDEVDADGARAAFTNGVLDVTIPKRHPEKSRAKSVEVH